MHDLNDIAAEALEIFKVKLSGAVSNDARLYECRKALALAATAGLPYAHERFGNVMLIGQHWINQVKLPLTEAAQVALLDRMSRWVTECLSDAAKRSAGPVRSDGQLAAAAATVTSGSGLKKRGGKTR
jgi:hypothetical protein